MHIKGGKCVVLMCIRLFNHFPAPYASLFLLDSHSPNMKRINEEGAHQSSMACGFLSKSLYICLKAPFEILFVWVCAVIFSFSLLFYESSCGIVQTVYIFTYFTRHSPLIDIHTYKRQDIVTHIFRSSVNSCFEECAQHVYFQKVPLRFLASLLVELNMYHTYCREEAAVYLIT